MRSTAMKITMKGWVLGAALVLALTGCGGGGGKSSTPVAGGTPAPIDPGGAGVTLAPIQDTATGGSPTASFSNAVAINDAGTVVGFAETAAGSTFEAARWQVDTTGAPTVAPAPLNPIAGNTFSGAFSIDEAGNAVGVSAEGEGFVAVLWKAGATDPVKLPALSPGGRSTAYGINPAGTIIVGEAEDALFDTRAVYWRVNPDGTVSAPAELPVDIFAKGTVAEPLPSTFGTANGVNDQGWIVGEVVDGEGTSHAVLWRPTGAGGSYVATDLRRGGESGSVALAINALGQIAGEAEITAGVISPVVWADDGTGEFKRSLLAPSGSAVALNDMQLAAGRTGQSDGSTHAAFWDLAAGTAAVELFTEASEINDINNNGLVVGRKGTVGFIKRAE